MVLEEVTEISGMRLMTCLLQECQQAEGPSASNHSTVLKVVMGAMLGKQHVSNPTATQTALVKLKEA